MAKQAAPTPEPAQPGIEESLEALEAIVRRLEEGKDSLDESIKLFEEGMRLSAACRKRLSEAEARVEILMREAGVDTPAPFSPEEE
jgi:exodeoxyribonuclease VII small subunit